MKCFESSETLLKIFMISDFQIRHLCDKLAQLYCKVAFADFSFINVLRRVKAF